MPLEIRQFPCLSDNYGYLIRDRASGEVAAVDAPDAPAILAELAASGWKRLDLILNTHWHPDHTQAAGAVREQTGCKIVGPEESARVIALDQVLADGEQVDLGETRFDVIHTPGHTLGHIVFIDARGGEAFVGDTLFALGCGRLFEGTPEQMFDSLSRLSDLPDETRIWCAHEYTAANARFALSLDEPDGERRGALEAHARDIFALREAGHPTVPTMLGRERQLNPFLRAPDAAAFATLRAAKDQFRG
ncbi:hydroxyacylglutathione hydrolase [Brevundimonas sp.]|uniref:hydroxyacylglutathione hydrolase n=1 Tax=Brevundimonas sp. TaxID=1871086 RepID=UPI00391DD433